MFAMKMKERRRKNKLYFVSKIKPSKNKATREHRATHRKWRLRKKYFWKKYHSSYVKTKWSAKVKVSSPLTS